MADLMSGSYTYEKLEQLYDCFGSPLVRIKINGTDVVSTLRLRITDMVVKLSLEAASTVVIKISDIYDEESHSFDRDVKGKFKLGAIAEVELGYQSSALPVFKGYVAMLGAEFGTVPVLTVTLMDARRLMMQSGSRHILHDVKNYSDAFNAIISDYAKLCSPVVDSTNDSLEKPLSQTQNDYLFITQELIKNSKVNREFFVLGDKVYFREPRKQKLPIISLMPGRGLVSLSVNESYQDLKVQVQGYDMKQQQVLTATANVTAPSGQKKICSQTPTLCIVDATADSQKKADDRAKAAAERKAWETQTGQGVTVGMPELVPGRYVQVTALEKDFADHKYYITEVTHELNEEHFHTIFEIGGWM